MSSNKRTRASTSKAQPSFDTSKYVSKEAYQRSMGPIATKLIVQERGLEAQHPGIQEQVTARRWEKLVKQPRNGVVSVVREFYANYLEQKDGHVFVRGKAVKATRAAINAWYDLLTIKGDQLKEFVKNPDYELVVQTIAKPGTQWKRNYHRECVTIPKERLLRQSKAWHFFILAKLVPGIHASTVDTQKASLNYAIQAGLTIDVGRVIQNEMLNTLSNDGVSLYFPSLITELCREAGVPIQNNEEFILPKAVISQRMVDAYKDNDGDEGPSSPQQGPPPPSNPSHARLDRIEQRLEHMDTTVGNLQHTMNLRFDEMMAAINQLTAQFPQPPMPMDNQPPSQDQ